jgi:hypothetical protein
MIGVHTYMVMLVMVCLLDTLDGSNRYQGSIKTMAEDNANIFTTNNPLPNID